MEKRNVRGCNLRTDIELARQQAAQSEAPEIKRGVRPNRESSPEARPAGEELVRAIAGMKALRKKIGRLTLEEILSARDEGRK